MYCKEIPSKEICMTGALFRNMNTIFIMSLEWFIFLKIFLRKVKAYRRRMIFIYFYNTIFMKENSIVFIDKCEL